jgi:hypothetical protein
MEFLQPLAIASTVGALPIGYLIYQLYEWRYNPHYKTMSFEYIKKNMEFMHDDCCLALIDCLLKDVMYKKYPGYADTLRGFWDNYDARFIIGWIVPLISALLAIVVGIIIYFSFNDYFLVPSCKKWAYLLMFIIYLIISYFIVFRPSKRIRKQVESQEFFLIYSLKTDFTSLRKQFLEDPNFAECRSE